MTRGYLLEMNFRMVPFEVRSSRDTGHHYQWVIVLVWLVIHWGVKHALLLLSTTTTTTTSRVLDSGGLSPIPEGEEEGTPSPNATVSEGAPAEVAQKAAEFLRLPPARTGRKRGGHSWLAHTVMSTLWHLRK